jgi:hypothetical protein
MSSSFVSLRGERVVPFPCALDKALSWTVVAKGSGEVRRVYLESSAWGSACLGEERACARRAWEMSGFAEGTRVRVSPPLLCKRTYDF